MDRLDKVRAQYVGQNPVWRYDLTYRLIKSEKVKIEDGSAMSKVTKLLRDISGFVGAISNIAVEKEQPVKGHYRTYVFHYEDADETEEDRMKIIREEIKESNSRQTNNYLQGLVENVDYVIDISPGQYVYQPRFFYDKTTY